MHRNVPDTLVRKTHPVGLKSMTLRRKGGLLFVSASMVVGACDMTPQEAENFNRTMRELAAAIEANQPVRPYYQSPRPSYSAIPYPPPAPSVSGIASPGTGRGCGGVPCGARTCGVQ